MTFNIKNRKHKQKGAVMVEAAVGLGFFLISFLCCLDILWGTYSNFALQYVADSTTRNATLNGGRKISKTDIDTALKVYSLKLGSADEVLFNNTQVTADVTPTQGQFFCVQIKKSNLRLSGFLGFALAGVSCGVVEPKS